MYEIINSHYVVRYILCRSDTEDEVEEEYVRKVRKQRHCSPVLV